MKFEKSIVSFRDMYFLFKEMSLSVTHSSTETTTLIFQGTERTDRRMHKQDNYYVSSFRSLKISYFFGQVLI